MGALKLAPDLEAADRAFAHNTNKLADIADRITDPEVRQVMSDTVESMINLAQGLKIALGTPKYITNNGPTIKRDQHNEFEHVHEFNNHKSVHYQHQTHHHEMNVEAQPGDWIYWLSSDLIISTNGKFAFRPQTKKLIMAIGSIDLTDVEVQELFRVLKKDFALRGNL